MLQVGRVDANRRQVGLRVFAYQRSRERSGVRERHFDLRSAVDDVGVGQNETVRRDDETAATAAHAGRPLLLRVLNTNIHD